VILAEHLGPHPLLAEALHARLAQVGLARESRVRGLSISNAANGVLVLADRGEDAVRAAGVAAVLLAGRLAAPAVHASIDNPQGIAAAVEQLHAMGASRVVIAPCLIGPETDPRELDAVSAAIGALAAPPLGAHPAIGQLVAMRYGNALAGLRPADSSLG
jgi:sirohydrochlorin ferrochelatase